MCLRARRRMYWQTSWHRATRNCDHSFHGTLMQLSSGIQTQIQFSLLVDITRFLTAALKVSPRPRHLMSMVRTLMFSFQLRISERAAVPFSGSKPRPHIRSRICRFLWTGSALRRVTTLPTRTLTSMMDSLEKRRSSMRMVWRRNCLALFRQQICQAYQSTQQTVRFSTELAS